MGLGKTIKKAVKKAVKKPVTSLLKASTLGLANKQIDQLKNATYGKSGLRDMYLKNQHLINNTAGMVALGALAPGVAMALPGSGGALLAGAAGTGYMMDKKDKAKAQMQAEQAAAQAAKDEAGRRLDDTLGGIVGDPNSPVVGDPNAPQIPQVNQPIDPTTGQPIDPTMINDIIGSTPNTGGAVNTGGTASKDQQDLLNEAELQYKLQNEQAGTSKAEREKMLNEYAALISQQQNRMLDENAPALYEDLNTRGLLRSSELGNAMGRERGKAAAILQEQVGLQGLTDRDSYIKALEGSTDNYLTGRSGAIQRRYSLEDFARQAAVAKDTGLALAPISTGTPSSKAGDAAMVGAGAQVAGALNGKAK